MSIILCNMSNSLTFIYLSSVKRDERVLRSNVQYCRINLNVGILVYTNTTNNYATIEQLVKCD